MNRNKIRKALRGIYVKELSAYRDKLYAQVHAELLTNGKIIKIFDLVDDLELDDILSCTVKQRFDDVIESLATLISRARMEKVSFSYEDEQLVGAYLELMPVSEIRKYSLEELASLLRPYKL